MMNDSVDNTDKFIYGRGYEISMVNAEKIRNKIKNDFSII